MDIHNYKKRLVRTLENIKNSKLSANNKKVIFKFHDNCFTEGLSICKIERYLYDLGKFALMLKKDLMKSTKDDIKSIVADIEKKEWSPHTKHTFKVMIRKFYKSIEGPEEKGVYPERIRWLHSNVKYSSLKLPEELITEEDVQKMITSTNNLRDRALVSILFESGCRIGEIGNLRIKDLTFDEYGMKINVSGKTGGRRVRLVNSVPYIQAWINIHPENQNPDSYLWIGRDSRELLGYTTFAYIPKHLAELAGIKKRIYPHLFRHSRATFLARHLTEAQMKDNLGWTQSSKMAGIYVHMSGRDTDNAILKLNGIKMTEESKPEEKLKAKPCVRCKTSNEPTNKFCKLCGMILNAEEANKMLQEELSFGNKEKEYAEMFANLKREIEGLKKAKTL